MKKYRIAKIFLYALLSISIIAIGIYAFMDNKKKVLQREVYQYLMDEKDYKEEDIYSMKTYWTQGYGFTSEVTFDDERDFYYQYTRMEHIITQVHYDEIPDPAKNPTPYVLLKPKHAEN